MSPEYDFLTTDNLAGRLMIWQESSGGTWATIVESVRLTTSDGKPHYLTVNGRKWFRLSASGWEHEPEAQKSIGSSISRGFARCGSIPNIGHRVVISYIGEATIYEPEAAVTNGYQQLMEILQ